MTILGLAKPFKTINRSDTTRPDRNALLRFISRKVLMIQN